MSFTDTLQAKVVQLLRWSEKYTKTDMVYLAQGGFWLTLELVVAAVFSLVIAIVFGHYANQSIYGNYKYILSIAALLSGISLSGMGIAITQAVSKGKEGALKQGVVLNLRWSIPMALIALCVALYYYVQGNSFVAVAMCIVAIAAPFVYSFQLFDNFLIGRREFSRSATYSVTTNLATLLALIAALFLGQRAIWLVVAYFAINLLVAAFFYIRTTRRARNDETDPDMLRYGFHLSVMSIIGSLADQIDSIAIFALLGPANLAVYTYAIAMPEQLKGILKNTVGLSMPKFAQRTIAEIKKNIYLRMVYLSLAVAFGLLLYVLLVPFIFHYLFPIYMSSVPYSRLYAISILFTAPGPIATSVLQAHKKTRALYISNNVGPLVLIIVLPTLTYFLGIEGAILSQIAYRFVNMAAALWQFALATD